MLRQGDHGGDQPVTDRFGIMAMGQVHQQGVTGGAFHQGADRGLVEFTGDQVALPVPEYRRSAMSDRSAIMSIGSTSR